jgi:hypothetical protein
MLGPLWQVGLFYGQRMSRFNCRLASLLALQRSSIPTFL